MHHPSVFFRTVIVWCLVTSVACAQEDAANVVSTNDALSSPVEMPAAEPTPDTALIEVAAVMPPSGQGASEWLAAHSKYRDAKGLPALDWSSGLAGIATEWAQKLAAEQCGSLEHRPSSYRAPRDIGENLATASASPAPPERGPTSAVDDWASEAQFYDHSANRCQEGEVCGHFTQVVWRATQEVGCAESTCTDGEWQTKVWVCNYRPAGNIVGQSPY